MSKMRPNIQSDDAFARSAKGLKLCRDICPAVMIG